jgi:hypothetical protein
MGKNVLKMAEYRHQKAKLWRKRYESHLADFFRVFIHNHLTGDLIWATQNYQNRCYQNELTSWDYQDFRDLMVEAIEESLGEILYQDLRKQWWFDIRWFSKEEAVDRCLSTYILGEEGIAISSR